MRRLLNAIFTVGSSRAVPPLVVGLFFLFYIGIAFFTDEALVTLMAFTQKSRILAALLALIPLNRGLRIVRETSGYLRLRKILAGKRDDGLPELFDETVELSPSPRFEGLEGRLASEGYTTRASGNSIAAWRGVSIFPARMLFVVGTFCLFAGILVSITSRTAYRQMVVEGEPFPTPDGSGGQVERIVLANSSGAILSRTLTMEVAPSGTGGWSRRFGLYPPSLSGGAFVYPRYLGLSLFLRFSAPDLPSGYETRCSLNTYPPGKEDSVPIPGSPYRIVFSIPEPDAGSDRYQSYMTGNITLQFKLLKGKDVLFTGSAPAGGGFSRDGYRLDFPSVRRLVVTDFISDYGVILIWISGILFVAAGGIWLPIRVFFPRREMLFSSAPGMAIACSRTEGRGRRHTGVFHEALDQVEAGKSGTSPL